jgi:hypothetical protein
MQTAFIILLGLALVACAFNRTPRRTNRFCAQHLRGWQKLFGLLAVVLTLLIIINPEFLALGLLGDAAFFDMLVLVTSLQMYIFASRAWHSSLSAIAKAARWLGIPSPGLIYLVGVVTPFMASTFSTVQKAVQRIFS